MKPTISRMALVSRTVNAVIVICAAALLYAGCRYLHQVGYGFEADAIIVGGLLRPQKAAPVYALTYHDVISTPTIRH